MSVEHHGSVGFGHVGPPLEHRMVLVNHRAHDRANVERLLAVFVQACGEDVANGGELAGGMHVRVVANIAVRRVGSLGAAREPFSRSDIGVVVVGEEKGAGRLQVRRPVLGLTIGTHHAVIPADAEIILCRDPTGVIEGLLAGEHHGAVGCHHQNALGVHEHRRFGIPIWLRADIDPGDDDVDLTAVLGEGDDSAKRTRHPVHVLCAARQRNCCPGGQCEPLDRNRQLFGQVQRRYHAGAFGFGDGTKGLCRVAEHGDAGHALRVSRRRPRHLAHDESGSVAAVWAVHRDQLAGRIEVVLDECTVAAG